MRLQQIIDLIERTLAEQQELEDRGANVPDGIYMNPLAMARAYGKLCAVLRVVQIDLKYSNAMGYEKRKAAAA